MPAFEQITPHVFKLNLEWELGIPFYAPIPVAVWLVKEYRQWTLIDAGPPGVEGALPELVAAQVGEQPLARLVLTHAHLDHNAALLRLRDRWPVLPVWAHGAERAFVEGKRGFPPPILLRPALPCASWLNSTLTCSCPATTPARASGAIL